MSNGDVATLIVLVSIYVSIPLIVSIRIYNKLQASLQEIQESISNLRASIQQRIDLTRQIIDIASQYGEYEKSTFAELSNNMDGALERVNALAQNYPQLKANETYKTLMQQLERLERAIFERRESYNQCVKSYNVKRNSFPAILVARLLGYEPAHYFDNVDNIRSFKRRKSVSVVLRYLLNKGGVVAMRTTQFARNKIAEQIEKGKSDPWNQ